MIDFAKTDAFDEGEYLIRVFVTFQNYYRNETSLSFFVQVFEPKPIDWSLKPYFYVELQD